MKSAQASNILASVLININMRCIEMLDILLAMNVIRQININMRCIEIQMLLLQQAVAGRLTLT